MSMTINVVGFKPPNKKFKQMEAAYNACIAAGVDVPKGVDKFFFGSSPDSAGVEVFLEGTSCCKDLGGNSGFEIDITKLPKDVTLIRFENSW